MASVDPAERTDSQPQFPRFERMQVMICGAPANHRRVTDEARDSQFSAISRCKFAAGVAYLAGIDREALQTLNFHCQT